MVSSLLPRFCLTRSYTSTPWWGYKHVIQFMCVSYYCIQLHITSTPCKIQTAKCFFLITRYDQEHIQMLHKISSLRLEALMLVTMQDNIFGMWHHTNWWKFTGIQGLSTASNYWLEDGSGTFLHTNSEPPTHFKLHFRWNILAIFCWIFKKNQ